MVYQTFLAFGGFLATRESEKADIDDLPFRLQYKVTTAIIFLATALISASELVGDNIQCHAHKCTGTCPENLGAFAESYCWITGLYVTPESWGAGKDDEVRDHNRKKCKWMGDVKGWELEDEPGADCIKNIGYYQWIPYVLLLQGLLFYAPRFLWVLLEEGKLSDMLKGILVAEKKDEKKDDEEKKPCEKCDKKCEKCAKKKTQEEKESEIAGNVLSYIDMKDAGHMQYGWGYVVAQASLILVIFICFWFNNLVTDGDFAWLGPKWVMAPTGWEIKAGDLESGNMNKAELLYRIFPRRANCKVVYQGMGWGNNVRHYICILAPNVLSQWVFLLLWFWFAALLIIHSINLLRVLLMALKFSTTRQMFLMSVVGSTKLDKELENESGKLSTEIKSLNFGQFLFLYFVARNTSFDFVQKLLHQLKMRGAPEWCKPVKKRGEKAKKSQDKNEKSGLHTPTSPPSKPPPAYPSLENKDWNNGQGMPYNETDISQDPYNAETLPMKQFSIRKRLNSSGEPRSMDSPDCN